MANVCQQRPVLVEIPAPQPKIAGRIRRSYLDVLSSRMATVPYNARSGHSKRGRPLEAAVHRQWVGKSESPSEELDASQTTLSKQQLVELLSSLILLEQKQEPRALTSDLKLLLEDLHQKKANVYRSIPYSRLGSNRDAHCYRKACPHLLDFKRSCQEGGEVLLQRGEWDSVLEFSLVAWRYASELPHWDTSSHNLTREQCYRTLATHCTVALQHRSPATGKARELLRRFQMAQMHSQVIAPCVQELQRLLGESKNRAVGDASL